MEFFEIQKEDIITVTGDETGLVFEINGESAGDRISIRELLLMVFEKAGDENNSYIIEKKGLTRKKVVFLDKIKELTSFEKALKHCKTRHGEEIYMGNLQSGEIYRYNKVSAVIMASGFSKRMGRNKLFIKFQGETMLERILKILSNMEFHEVILVGKDDETMKLGEKYKVKYIKNENSNLGQSESVKLGVSQSSGEGIVFFTVDQPMLSEEIVLKLMWEFYKKNIITLPVTDGQKSTPVFFPQEKKTELLKIEGDTGGREIIRKSSQINEVYFMNHLLFKDVDSLEDLEEIYGKMQGDS
ncbi:NTP transferase domain-containing protein [uncultured Ilyobacter sp.]|uniref:NTP transferase domain-containing protein n=1 Tax=uncultured Ilyobacter sp. TaxID=544433 RepID=UPI0029F4E1B5|nr:NTP transferase domain-containing protein [uncultured Ilyobacter sp.]